MEEPEGRDQNLRAPGSAWGQVLYFDNFTSSTELQDMVKKRKSSFPFGK